MKIECYWKQNLQFNSEASGFSVAMDAKKPLGDETALTPKQLLLAAICGCSGMDVVSLMKKYRQIFKQLTITAEATPSKGVQPAIFTAIHLRFEMEGEVEGDRLAEAVRLSQTQFCGVSAMVVKTVPITYQVYLNGVEISSGKSDFSL